MRRHLVALDANADENHHMLHEATVLEQLSAPQTFTQLGRPRDRVISYVTSRLFDLRDAWYAFIDAPLDLERQSQVRVLTQQMLTLVLSLHAQ
jgi:hypothetical protein